PKGFGANDQGAVAYYTVKAGRSELLPAAESEKIFNSSVARSLAIAAHLINDCLRGVVSGNYPASRFNNKWCAGNTNA
uniref:hypothetical protein n=1 Tax=Streptomyces niveiscabiei TaxID=164115 RepID=UPI0038F7CC66